MRASPVLSVVVALVASCHAYHAPRALPVARRAAVATFSSPPASATADTAAAAAPAVEETIPLPRTLDQQITAMRTTILRARDAGVDRQRVRVLLPRNGILVPPDETWEGGIMELYYAISPMVQRLLRQLIPPVSGVPPRVTEKRIDESGVDGEALWSLQAASAKDDLCAFVQPSVENRKDIEEACAAAKERLVLMVNPQYRESDDTLDYLSKSNGLLKAVASFLGGKAAFVEKLDELGFVDTFNLQSCVIRGSEMWYFKTFPDDWRIFINGDDDVPVFLGSTVERPDYNKVDAVLEANKVAPKFQRDLNMFPRLTSESITIFYTDDDE